MSAHAKAWLAAYDRLDASLVAAGWPPTSPWWRAELERFIRSGKRRWVVRAGRRAGKSSTLCRVAICQGITPGWSVPPGDVAVISFTSLDRDEAGSRLRTIDEALTALGIPHDRTNDEISIPSKRLVFRVTTCSIRAVGFTSIMLVGDEMARWESRDTAANPAKEVMASQRPTMATQPFGIEVDCSSPWGEDDYHHELFEAGDTDHQCVSFAPSWVANPTLTEALTRELEPDDRVWSREYAAIPGATVSQALDAVDVRAAFAGVNTPKPIRLGRTFCAIDASSLRGDGFCWTFASEHSEFGLLIGATNGIEGDELRNYSMAMIVDRIAKDCAVFSVRTVFGDQRESASLESMFAAVPRNFRSFDWSETSKALAFQTLRRLLRERRIHFEPHEKLMKEMLSCKAHLRPSGRMSYTTNGLDYLSCIVTLMHAINEDLVNPNSHGQSTPIEQPRGEDSILAGLSGLASL